MLLARRAIERADVVVLVIDATAAPPIRTPRLPARPTEAGRGIIVAANKWDLMEDSGPDARQGVRRRDPRAS